MPTVTVQPSGIELEADAGQTVFEAARAAGYRWPTVCEGQGSCHMCFMQVLEGIDNLDAVQSWEAEGLEELGNVGTAGERTRLACQARVRGDVTVLKRGVRLAKPAVSGRKE